jgi:uncharacterized membrane protein YdjX (TVP38/TMEM64 family)
MSLEKARVQKIPVLKLAIAVVVLAGLAVFFLRGTDVRGLMERSLAAVRSVGPTAFFTAMTILPCIGVPNSLFAITAGELFAPTLGMPTVIALSLVVLLVNLALTYWLARYALRPMLIKVLARYGYSVPRVTAGNALGITLVMRLTPGVPFAVQGYVLGVAEVPFGLYLVVSWICQVPWVVGFIVFGQGLLKGNFIVAAKGLGVIVVAAVAVHFLRKKLANRER